MANARTPDTDIEDDLSTRVVEPSNPVGGRTELVRLITRLSTEGQRPDERAASDHPTPDRPAPKTMPSAVTVAARPPMHLLIGMTRGSVHAAQQRAEAFRGPTRHTVAKPTRVFDLPFQRAGAIRQAGAVGREACTIRLSAEIGYARDRPHFWLTAAAAGFERWAAHSLDSLVANWGTLDVGTFPRIRRTSPDFVGYLICLPTAMTWAPTTRITNDVRDRARFNSSFLSTDEDPSVWATRIDLPPGAAIGATPETHRLPYLPFFNQLDDPAAATTFTRGLIGTLPAGVPRAVNHVDVYCNAKPLQLDPIRGRKTLARAIARFCADFGADGVRLDETTTSYKTQSGAEGAFLFPFAGRSSCGVPFDERIDSAFSEARYALRVGGVGQYSDEPYSRNGFGEHGVFPFGDCRGSQSADPNACRIAMNRALMESLGDIARSEIVRVLPGRKPLSMWLNFHAALFNRASTQTLLFGADITTGPLYDRYGNYFLSPADRAEPDRTPQENQVATDKLLNNGGWFEEFVLNSDEGEGADERGNPLFPYSVDVEIDGPAFFAEADSATKRITLRGEGIPFDEEFSVYRVKTYVKSVWRGAVKFFAATGGAGGRARADVAISSMDDFQAGLASYLFCRFGVPGSDLLDDPVKWKAIGPGQPIPGLPGARLSNPTLSVFPRFIYPRAAQSFGTLKCTDGYHAGKFECRLPGAQSYFTIPNENRDSVDELYDDRLPNVRPKEFHPLVAMATLGGTAWEPDGSSSTTALRLLLDLELGQALGCATLDGMYLCRFEFGEAVYLPLPESHRALSEDVRLYNPAFPRGGAGFYFAVDAPAVEAIVQSGPLIWRGLSGRLPDWAALPPNRNQGDSFDAPVVRRALESGLQSVDAVPAQGNLGTPGICLRWTGAGHPPVALLPGMGRVIIYPDSPIGQRLLRYFPVEAQNPPRRVTAATEAFLALAGVPQAQGAALARRP